MSQLSRRCFIECFDAAWRGGRTRRMLDSINEGDEALASEVKHELLNFGWFNCTVERTQPIDVLNVSCVVLPATCCVFWPFIRRWCCHCSSNVTTAGAERFVNCGHAKGVGELIAEFSKPVSDNVHNSVWVYTKWHRDLPDETKSDLSDELKFKGKGLLSLKCLLREHL